MISETVLRARWIEAETIQLKRIGLTFDAIADQLTRIGRGQAQPIIAIPDSVSFLADFQISRQACHKAFRKTIAREPSLAVDEFRRLDSARCEDMFASLQPGVRKGNPRAVEASVKVLRHLAQLNGYTAPTQDELTGKDGKPLTLVQLLQAIGPIDKDDRQ